MGEQPGKLQFGYFFFKKPPRHSLRLAWPQRLWEKLRKWGSCVFKIPWLYRHFPSNGNFGENRSFFSPFPGRPMSMVDPLTAKGCWATGSNLGWLTDFFWQILTDPDLSANTSHEPWAITSNLILESKHEHHSIWAYLGYTHLPRISTLDSWMQVYIRWISPHAFHLHEPYKVVPSSFGLVYKPH